MGHMMKTVAVFEAKNRASELLAAVERGEEITITRHGSPVERQVALASSVQQPAPKQCEHVFGAMQHLRALGAGAALGCTLQQALESGRD
jgi:antitoxin (DNA-binding transcriptional repressor) of toxin-antitoxin stability system